MAANVGVHFETLKNTGGVWDAEERRQYFFATNEGMTAHIDADPLIHRWLLVAVNEIDATMEAMMDSMYKLGARWFIDSGIFNLTNEHMRAHGITMDEALALAPEEIDGFDALFEKYVDLVRRWQDKCWGYIELDQGGRENKIKTRARLESMGLNPIPVYHPFNDGWDYFDYLAERYDRICFGNIVQADQATRKRLIATAWERKRKYPHLWIHLLGYTPNQTLNAYPIDSADSSSWLSAVRWSGLKTKTALQTVGDMPINFRYILGQTNAPGAEYQKAVAMSGYSCAMDVRNWHNHLNAMEKIGCTLYPEDSHA